MKTTTPSILALLAERFGRDAPLSLPIVFLEIANAGSMGVDQGELQARLDMQSSTMSRQIQALSRVHWMKDRPGLDLIERQLDPTDNRRRVLTLTHKGRDLVDALKALDRPTSGAA